jgi:SAM-dependent methyltransferase
MSEYAGTDSLEVMTCAVRYNAYLLGLVEQLAERDARILDFGAGIGTFAARLRDRGYSVECVEPDPKQGALIESKGLVNRLSASDFAERRFDLVYSFNVFEHVDDHVQAMRDVLRVLRPGGQLLAYVPALGFLFTSMDAKVGHVRRYTRATLTKAMREAGFTIDEARYADIVGVPATLAYKWFGNEDGSIHERALIAYDRAVFPISRALDRATDRLLGKNVWALGRRA